MPWSTRFEISHLLGLRNKNNFDSDLPPYEIVIHLAFGKVSLMSLFIFSKSHAPSEGIKVMEFLLHLAHSKNDTLFLAVLKWHKITSF